MSRLDSRIRQKIAQRDSINLAAGWLAGEEGIIVERFPGREIFCFDRLDETHPRSRPPADHLYLGEFADTLANPALPARFAGRVIFAHIDVGSGGPEDEVIPELVMDRIAHWLKPGGPVLSDQDLTLEPAWQMERVVTAGEVEHADRYYVYRRRAD